MLSQPQTFKITLALRCLEQQGVLAYPTESIWGLGCLPEHEIAVEKILRLKKRAWQKGLILVASNWQQLEGWIKPLTADEWAYIRTPQPQPTTWLLPCYNEVSQSLRGAHKTLAVRVSTHPIIQALCEQAGPIVSTSANIQARPPAKNALQVQKYFHQQVDYILSGQLGGYKNPSNIKTLCGNRVR